MAAEAIPAAEFRALMYLGTLFPDMLHILQLKKNAAAVLFLSGVLFGAIGTRLMAKRAIASKPKEE